MSELDSFSGLEGAAGMDPKAFEKFQEQMRENSAAIAALQKAQAAQQQKEDKLAQILRQFIQTSTKRDLVVLITQLLAQNIPAGFVLSLVLLGNEDVQEMMQVRLSLPEEDMRRLESAEKSATNGASHDRQLATLESVNMSELPIRVRVAIDLWAKGLISGAMSAPSKTLSAVHMPGATRFSAEYNKTLPFQTVESYVLKDVVVQTAVFLVDEFMRTNSLTAVKSAIYEFCHFLLTGIFEKVRQSLENPELMAAKKDKPYL